jgi:hypothetical protein
MIALGLPDQEMQLLEVLVVFRVIVTRPSRMACGQVGGV